MLQNPVQLYERIPKDQCFACFAAAAALTCCARRAFLLLLCGVQLYERILKNQGFPYFVNGAGGQSLNGFATTLEAGETQHATSTVTSRHYLLRIAITSRQIHKP
jgi:hypothetical protein